MGKAIQCLGWFVRRSRRPVELVDFYHHIVGLPVLRRSPEISMLWAGETIVFEIMPGGTRPPTIQSRFDSPCTPLFRTHNLAASLGRLGAAGVTVLEEVSVPGGQVAYLVDPDGNLFGLQERSRASDRAEDREAFRRWDAGRRTIPGVDALPSDLQHLGWVVLRTANHAGLGAFYRDIVGLNFAHDLGERGVTFEIGDTTMLELLPGGMSRPRPIDRAAVTDSIILRVHDLETLVGDVTSHGVPFIDQPFDIPGGRLAFFSDPEGTLIGLQERAANDSRPEEAEAWRRWNGLKVES